MTFHERLTDVFDRGLRHGEESLSREEQELFLIQEFVIDFDMGGLSGYLYNRLPNHKRIRATVQALRRHDAPRLATLLDQAMCLFESYRDSKARDTWANVLRHHDPNDRLPAIEAEIYALKDYGLLD